MVKTKIQPKSGRKYTSDEVKQIVKNKNNNEVLNPEDYISVKTKNLKIVCGSCGYVRTMSLEAVMMAPTGKCRSCASKIKASKWAYSKEDINNIITSKNDVWLNPEEYINVLESNIRVICWCCHNEFKTSARVLMNGTGLCFNCHNSLNGHNALPIDKVIQMIESINSNKLINPMDYKTMKTPNLQIQCACGNIYKTSLCTYVYSNATRCPMCSNSISKGEYKIKQFLDSQNIQYSQEYSFKDCRYKNPLPFDFYINNKNACIEYDGEQHFRPIERFGGEKEFEIVKKRDNIKTQFCKDNGITLIRIPYWEYSNIENILRDKLVS